RQQFEMQLLHYQNTEKQYEKYRQFKHDYQANIDLLRNLINDNLNTEAQDLINEMENHEIVQCWNRKHFTNNVIFDSMMQELARKCKDANIKLFFEGQEPRRTNLTLIEKITLFHNITFNAYEANLKLKEEERYILIRVNNQDAWTSIHVENAFDGNINYKDGKYHSTKTNGDEHGIGLENVEEVTQKLGGVLTITPDTEKRIFYLCVLLPSHGK